MLLKKFQKCKIIITGHTGFKGSWLTAWLKKLGANVLGISLDPPTNPSHYTAAQLHHGRRCHIDIQIKIKWIELFGFSTKFVFHLAAQPLVKLSFDDPIKTYTTNFIGTLNLLEALRGIKQSCVTIIITSDKCYDNTEWVWGYRESDRLGGPDPYSASKGAAELVIRSHVLSYFPSMETFTLG